MNGTADRSAPKKISLPGIIAILLTASGFLKANNNVEFGRYIDPQDVVCQAGVVADQEMRIPVSFDTMSVKTFPAPVPGFVFLKMGGLGTGGSAGTPSLPVMTMTVRLRSGSEVTGVALRGGRFRELRDSFRIIPHPRPLTRDGFDKKENYYPVDAAVYNQSGYYPGRVVSYLTGSDNREAYCFIRLYPIQYQPALNKAAVLTGGEVVIYYRAAAREPDAEAALTNVIICPEELEIAANELKDFHQSRLGCPTTVVTTEWIGGNYAPAPAAPYSGFSQIQPNLIQNYDFDLSRRIVSYLRDVTRHPGLGSVTVLGDAAKVPPGYYFLMTPAAVNQEDFWAPSDFLYASPDYDWVPNYAVGRLPVSDPAEAAALIQKMKNWYPGAGDWFGKAVAAGGDPFPYYFPYYDEALVSQAVNEESFNGFDIEKHLLSDGAFTRSSVGSALAAGGFGVFYETGHGSGDAIALDDGSISANEVLGYPAQTRLPVVMSPACDIGAFDTDLVPGLGFSTSFGEALLKSKGGAIGFFGSTRLGNAGFEYHIDDGELVVDHRDYADAIFLYNIAAHHHGAPDLGEIYRRSIIDFVGDNDLADTLNQWTVFAFVLLGDPALKLPAIPAQPADGLPHSTAQSPAYRDGKGYPVFHLGGSDSARVTSTTDASGVRYKLCEATRAMPALDLRADPAAPFEYAFVPRGDLPLYLVRCETPDGKEAWFYTYATTGAIVVDGDKKDWQRASLAPVAADPADFDPVDYDVRNLYVTDDDRNWFFGFDELASDTTSIAYTIAVDCRPGGFTGVPGETGDGFGTWVGFGPGHPVDYEIFAIASNQSLITFLLPWGDTSWAREFYLPDSGGFSAFDSSDRFAELSVPKRLLGGAKTIAATLFSCGFVNSQHSPALDAAPSDPATYHALVFGPENANIITRFATVRTTGTPEGSPRTVIDWHAGPVPFRNEGEIRFNLPVGERTALDVYDATGRLVRKITAGFRPAGAHSVRWDGRDDAGIRLAAGIYFYRLRVGNETFTKKTVRVR